MGRRFSPTSSTQVILLLIVAIIVGAVANLVRPVPVPWDEATAFPLLPPIQPTVAYKSLVSGESLFVDARPSEFYQQGRILNAVSLPFKSSEEEIRELLPNPHPYREIILYCEDEHCDAADAMARRLKRMGYEKLFVLEGGWRSWTMAQLPTE